MRLCRFYAAHGVQFGRVVDDVIVPLAGNAFGDWREAGAPIPLADAILAPPTIPSSFFCAGLNYSRHIEEAQRRGNTSAKLPERPDVGHRSNNALIGHGQVIIKPPDCEGRFEYEAELVAVIGRQLRGASRNEAADGIFGWTIGNDVSARVWQHSDRTFWRAKNADTFKPMGPWIDTEATPLQGDATVRVNGVETSRFRTDSMIYSAVDFIVEITRYVTMQPGDVLWLGTDGMGALAPGDTVAITIDGLATLSNPVVAG